MGSGGEGELADDQKDMGIGSATCTVIVALGACVRVCVCFACVQACFVIAVPHAQHVYECMACVCVNSHTEKWPTWQEATFSPRIHNAQHVRAQWCLCKCIGDDSPATHCQY